jgi:hypothetical protein
MSTFLGFTSSTVCRPRRLILLIGVLAPCFLLSSCGRSGHKPVYPVRGQVFVDGQPAAQAFVVLHPEGEVNPQADRPYGHVGADGSFTLTTYDPGDGAPAGEYVVTVVWLAPAKSEDPPDRLAGRYRDPKTSKLRATVRNGPTELAPYQLTR